MNRGPLAAFVAGPTVCHGRRCAVWAAPAAVVVLPLRPSVAPTAATGIGAVYPAQQGCFFKEQGLDVSPTFAAADASAITAAFPSLVTRSTSSSVLLP